MLQQGIETLGVLLVDMIAFDQNHFPGIFFIHLLIFDFRQFQLIKQDFQFDTVGQLF